MFTDDVFFRLSLMVWGLWWLDMALASTLPTTVLRSHVTLWWGIRWAWRVGVWSWTVLHIPAFRERLFLSPPESPHAIILALLLTLAYVGVALVAWALARPQVAPDVLPLPASSYVFTVFALADAFTQQAVYALIRASASDSRQAWWLMVGVGFTLLPLGWYARQHKRPWPHESEVWAWLGIVGGTGLVLSTRFIGTAIVWDWLVRLATRRSRGAGVPPPSSGERAPNAT